MGRPEQATPDSPRLLFRERLKNTVKKYGGRVLDVLTAMKELTIESITSPVVWMVVALTVVGGGISYDVMFKEDPNFLMALTKSFGVGISFPIMVGIMSKASGVLGESMFPNPDNSKNKR